MAKSVAPEPAPSISFESAIERLEQIVTQLERGDAPLETALDLYEEGLKLAEQCGSTLQAARERLQVLQQTAGKLALKPDASANEESTY